MKTVLKRKLLIAALVPLFSAPIALTSHAQSSDTRSVEPSRTGQPAKATDEAKKQDALDVRASKLIGKQVKNAKGENVGEIKDLMVDLKGERVHYAVLGFGGAMGVGDKLFAYPVNAFKPGKERDEVVLNVDKEQLKNAPGFDKDKWPDWSDNRYRGEVERFHKGNVPKLAAGATLMRASELIGKSVDDRAGSDAGEIEDLVVNLREGRVRYAVLDFDKKWSPDDKLVVLPLKAFNIPADKDKDLVLNVSRDSIKTAQAFDENQWPDLNERKYRRDVDNFIARFRPEREAGAERAAGAPGTAGTTQSGR